MLGRTDNWEHSKTRLASMFRSGFASIAKYCMYMQMFEIDSNANASINAKMNKTKKCYYKNHT